MPITRGAVAGALRRHRGRAAAAVLAVVLLALVGAFGGFERARAARTSPEIAVGDHQDTGPVDLVVEGVRLLDAPKSYGSTPADQARTWVVIVVQAENTSDDALADLGWLARPVGVPGIVEDVLWPRVVLARDGATVFQLQPHLREKIGFAFPLRNGATPPRAVDISLGRRVWRQEFFSGTWGWRSDPDRPPPTLVRGVPVVDRRGR